MSEIKQKIDQMEAKLSGLIRDYNVMGKELVELRNELNHAKSNPQQYIPTEKTKAPEKSAPVVTAAKDKPHETEQTDAEIAKPADEAQHKEKHVTEKPQEQQTVTEPKTEPVKKATPYPFETKKEKSSVEKFIGENLINKIGIIITILGVAIGVKYSIEHQLISPLVRIILGYLLGFVLILFGIKLKEKYVNYSAVLVSGAIAIMYFITFAAYSFYNLFPQLPAFVLMLVFTVFTVIAAIHYNKQIIAHIGLVGAYAVPFLLSDGSGRVLVLFTYMAVINIGILFIAYKKYWKPLYYVAFALTWVIFLSWYIISYHVNIHFSIALVFSIVFFLTFYAMFMAYKLVRHEQYSSFDIMPLLVNSFVFYGLGYAILSSHEMGRELLGLFTVLNAVIHFIASIIIYKQKLADKNLLYLIIALVFVFITIAIPVQLDGNWVTLLWAIEAFLLFAIAQSKNISIYRNISYPLMLLAFISLIQDWKVAYSIMDNFSPVLNTHFMTSLIVVAAFGGINYFYKKYPLPESHNRILIILLPGLLIVTAYFSGLLEVQHYWNQLYENSQLSMPDEYSYYIYNDGLKYMKTVWIANYSLLFAGALSILNCLIFKNFRLGVLSSVATIGALFLFLTTGLYALSELRELYLAGNDTYQVTSYYITLRYISFTFVAVALCGMYWLSKLQSLQSDRFNIRIMSDVVLHISLIWIVSSELIHWLDMAGNTQTYKFGLSILWGAYALMLVALGIWKRKKYLRVGGIVLLAVTLVKLFFYDLSGLNTIAKTIVFISLGLLLLIVSFLYNKYKHLINDDDENRY